MRVCYTDSHYITNCFSHPCDTNPPFCWRECAYMSLISRLRASLRQTLRSRGEPTTLLAHCKTNRLPYPCCAFVEDSMFWIHLLVPAPGQDARLARHLWRSKPHTLSLYIPCLFTLTCQAASLPQRSWSSPPAGRPPAQGNVKYHIKSLYIIIHILDL